MTFGYFITDLDALVSLLAGALRAKETCDLLGKLSSLPGPVEELKILKKRMMQCTLGSLFAFLSVFCSYIYVATLRDSFPFNNFYCTMLGNYKISLCNTTYLKDFQIVLYLQVEKLVCL